jgi:HEAT repeat protein
MKGKTTRRAIPFLCFVALLSLAPSRLAADSGSSSGAGSGSGAGGATSGVAKDAAVKEQSQEEKDASRRDTLSYGIDSEVIDLLKTLSSEKEKKFNAQILELYRESRNVKIRKAVLAFFADLEARDAEKDALALIENRDKEDPGLVQSGLQYLAQIKSKDALSFAPAIIKDDDRKLLPYLLSLLGRAGGPEEEDILLKWLESDAPTEDLRQSAIRALGDIGSAKAADKLMKMAEDSGQGKATRMYACEALGKIKDERAVRSLAIAADCDDPNVRASALGALAEFKGRDAQDALVGGLRDSAALVRVAALKACGRAKLASSLPAILYKASNDPEKSVKTEAFKALGEIGSKEAFDFFRKYYDEKKNDSGLRVLAFGLLLRKDGSSVGWLAERFAAEQKEKDRSFFGSLARELSASQDAANAAPLARLLLADSDYLMRLGALEWARKTKAQDFRADLEQAAEKDPSDYVRKKAKEVLDSYGT